MPRIQKTESDGEANLQEKMGRVLLVHPYEFHPINSSDLVLDSLARPIELDGFEVVRATSLKQGLDILETDKFGFNSIILQTDVMNAKDPKIADFTREAIKAANGSPLTGVFTCINPEMEKTEPEGSFHLVLFRSAINFMEVYGQIKSTLDAEVSRLSGLFGKKEASPAREAAKHSELPGRRRRALPRKPDKTADVKKYQTGNQTKLKR